MGERLYCVPDVEICPDTNQCAEEFSDTYVDTPDFCLAKRGWTLTLRAARGVWDDYTGPSSFMEHFVEGKWKEGPWTLKMYSPPSSCTPGLVKHTLIIGLEKIMPILKELDLRVLPRVKTLCHQPLDYCNPVVVIKTRRIIIPGANRGTLDECKFGTSNEAYLLEKHHTQFSLHHKPCLPSFYQYLAKNQPDVWRAMIKDGVAADLGNNGCFVPLRKPIMPYTAKDGLEDLAYRERMFEQEESGEE